MKKILSLILALCLMPILALAENLNEFTFDQLLILQDMITAEIISRPEWKEVEVPAGEWIVGEDIPAGTYSISCKQDFAAVDIYKSKGSSRSDKSYMLTKYKYVGKTELMTGNVVHLSGPVTFAPEKGLDF